MSRRSIWRPCLGVLTSGALIVAVGGFLFGDRAVSASLFSQGPARIPRPVEILPSTAIVPSKCVRDVEIEAEDEIDHLAGLPRPEEVLPLGEIAFQLTTFSTTPLEGVSVRVSPDRACDCGSAALSSTDSKGRASLPIWCASAHRLSFHLEGAEYTFGNVRIGAFSATVADSPTLEVFVHRHGRPRAATVSVYHAETDEVSRRLTFRTGANGRSFVRPLAGDRITAMAEAGAEFAIVTAQGEPLPCLVEIELGTKRAIQLKLVDEQGLGIAQGWAEQLGSGLSRVLSNSQGFLSFHSVELPSGVHLKVGGPEHSHKYLFVPAAHLETRDSHEPVCLGEVTLRAACTLRVDVQDQDGHGIARAEVEAERVLESCPDLLGGAGESRQRKTLTRSQGLTDSDGTVILRNLQPGTSYGLKVRHPGYASEFRGVQSSAGQTSITLAPAAGLDLNLWPESLIAEDPTIQVHCWRGSSMEEISSSPRGDVAFVETELSRVGPCRFSLASMTPGPVFLRISGDTIARSYLSTQLQAGTQARELHVAPAHLIRGRVTLPDGTPGSGAQLYLSEPGHWDQYEARADEDGEFSITGLPHMSDWDLIASVKRDGKRLVGRVTSFPQAQEQGQEYLLKIDVTGNE